MKFGNNIDLDWNQLQNARLQNLSSVPISKDSAEEGYIYYNTAQHRAQLYVKKVSGNSVVIDDWYNLLLGRENEIDPSWLQGGIGIGKLGCVLKDSDTNYLNSFAADENNLIPTTGAIYGFFKDALKRNDAMVYMGTFAAQTTSGVTLTTSMFTLTGNTHPENLTTFMSKGYTFKVTGSGYFGTIAVEAGDMIIVNTDSPGTTVSKYDVIQTNLTQYVTTFGGVSGAITLLNGQTTPGAINLTFPQNSSQLQASLVIGTPSMTWTDGTTSGPTLNLSALGMSLTATIPSATSLKSGVVTTTTQTFAGNKTFSGNVSITADTQYASSNNDAALKVSGGTHIAKILHVGGSSYFDGSVILANNKHIFFKDSNGSSFSGLALNSNNDLLLGFGADVRPNYNLYIDGATISIRNKYTEDGGSSTSSTTAICIKRNTVSSSTAVRVGVFTTSPQYKLDVNGTLGVADVITLSGSQSNTTASNKQKIQFGSYGYIDIIDLGSGNTPRYALHSSIPFYSDSWVASGGIGSGSGGSGGGSNIQLLNLSQCRSLASESAGSGKAAAAWAIKQLDTDYSSKYNNLVSSINTLRQDVNSISASGVVSVSSPTASNTGYLVTSVTKASDSTAISVTKVDIGSYSLTLNGGTAVSLIKTGSGNSSASFFAPTTVGTAGQVLLSGGSTTSNGVTTYNPPTWGYADRIKTSIISSNITDGLNNQAETAGLFVCPFSFDDQKEDKNTPTGVNSGVILRWNRYLNRNDGTVNTEVQLLTTTASNRLWFRNSWSNSSSSSTDKVSIVWKDWLEVATIGTNGNFETALGNSLNTALNSKFIHTYNVGRSISGASSRWDSTNSTTGYKTYTTAHTYDNSNLIVALYDNENKLVMTDVEIHLYDGSTESYVGKYGVRLSFAKPFPTGVTYKLVVYGTQNS